MTCIMAATDVQNILQLYHIIFQGATPRQGMMFCILVVLLYLSRVIYNLVAVTVPHDVSSFGFGWINVSDEVNNIKFAFNTQSMIRR